MAGIFALMAVILVTTPDAYALTRGGRMLFQFTGSGRTQTAGTQAINVLFVASPVTNGTTLNLRWNGQDHKITFKTAPSLPNEFTAGNGSAAYVDALLTELAGYYPLREDFVLTRNAADQLPGIIFTARQPGPAYDLTVGALPVGTPFGFGTSVLGSNALLRTQYSIYTEIWLQKPGTTGADLTSDYARVFSAPIETDLDGTAQFDVGNILHSQLTADWPVWALANASGAPNSHRKYYLAYGEAWGSPLQIGRIKLDQVRHAYLGGADFRHRSAGLNLSRFLSKALRFGSLTRYVRTDEPQFLTFLNQAADQAGTRLKIVVSYEDSSSQTFTDVFAPQTVLQGAKITYPVGPQQINLFSNPAGKHPVEYSVQRVAGDGSPLSEVYRYILNYDYQPYTRYFAYLSSLGTVETLATFGKGSHELARFSEQAERYLDAHYDVQDGQFVDYNVSIQQQVEVTTGFRTQADLRLWDDFYRSPNRFRIKDSLALPVGITSKSIKQAKDGDTLFAHKFEYQYLYKDDFYTGDEIDALGDGPPPPSFVPGSATVVVNQPTVIHAVDATIPDFIRGLTAGDITSFKITAARPNPESLGFLKQAATDLLYYRQDKKIDFANDLANHPTTRDGYGLSDVLTTPETASAIKLLLKNTVHIKPHLTSWTTEVEPS